MGYMSEGFARVVDGVVTGRRQRSELAAEIKNVTASRCREVRSLVDSLKASSGRRRSEVEALLDGFDKEDRDRAAAVRERLGSYALERRNAIAVWGGSPSGAQGFMRRGQSSKAPQSPMA